MQLAASNNPPETLTDFFPEQILGGVRHFVRVLLPHPGYHVCADDKFLHQALLVFRVSVSAAFFKEAVHMPMPLVKQQCLSSPNPHSIRLSI